MNCISREITHWGSHSECNVEYVAEDKSGNISPLYDDVVTLSVNEKNKRYTLKCGDATIAQGIYFDNIFETISELRKRGVPGPETIDRGGKVMIYEDFDKRYNNVHRKFKATTIREEEHTGIAITEYAGNYTYRLDSLYFPQRLSNKDTFITIVEHVKSLLDVNDYAILRMKGVQRKPDWSRSYYGQFTFKNESDKKSGTAFIETEQLAQDAIDRQYSISERFEEGIISHEKAEQGTPKFARREEKKEA
ncbi:transcriptional regulator [Oceanobacillus picturae]|uniref:Transcriptional regulator n=1 Tax=Oceanobacillus picturae TaxID=171693 RepID=A0A0U9H762_9BACI|nr:hypothetical protein [Oceanobacillus picturae]GAQ18526.1 transcriptional regulator [Oceanobacillus picturae]